MAELPPPPPQPRAFERAVPLAVLLLGLALILLGGWRAASREELVELGPFTLGAAWGPRLIMFGIVLLCGRYLLFPPPASGGTLTQLWRRLPLGLRFVGGAWVTYAFLVKAFNFFSLLWVPHFDQPFASVGRLWVDPLCREWDAAWYRSIALDGYVAKEGTSNVAFFPLFPLLLRGAYVVFADACWASWTLTQAALIAALAGVYRLSRDRLGDHEAARWSVILVLAWPFAFFYAAAYTEPLFLCLAVWAFVAAERRRYWIAGLLGALAASTRLTGLALLPALLLTPGWHRPGEPSQPLPALVRREVRPRLPLFLIPAGTIAFFSYLYFRFGDFWLNLRAANAGWGRGPGKGGYDLFGAARALFDRGQHPYLLMYTVQLLVGLAVLPLVRRLPSAHGWGYTLFVLGITLPGAMSGLEALGRYLAPAFPLAWMLIPTARQNPTLIAFVLVVFGILQGLFLFLHAHGYWVT